MARNGSGVFNRLYNWVTDAAGGVKILATRMDAEFDGVATALTESIAKDGQTTPTANLPMGGFKHTTVGNSAARNQYAVTGQIQDSAFTYAADTGAADAYAIGPSPAFTAYATGMSLRFKATNANTGASTLNVNGLGVKDIKKDYNSALVAGDIIANQIYDVVYDGTNFQLSVTGALAKTNTANTFSGLITLTGGQIKFPATAVPSSDANTLDDYEENTWTPGIAFAGSSTGITYTTQVGTYTKIGNKVFFSSVILLSNKGAQAGTVTVTGFPFSSENIASRHYHFSVYIEDVTYTGSISARMVNGVTTVTLYQTTEAGTTTALTNNNLINTSRIELSGHYNTT